MTRILLVEDDPDLRLVIGYWLADGGHDVTAVGSAEEALNHLADHDLLLLDIRLPGMSGLELLVRHLDAGGLAPAIVMSAHAGADIRAQALECGAAAMLTKPFPSQALLDEITRQLAA